jgi:hypothetical protein
MAISVDDITGRQKGTSREDAIELFKKLHLALLGTYVQAFGGESAYFKPIHGLYSRVEQAYVWKPDKKEEKSQEEILANYKEALEMIASCGVQRGVWVTVDIAKKALAANG